MRGVRRGFVALVDRLERCFPAVRGSRIEEWFRSIGGPLRRRSLQKQEKLLEDFAIVRTLGAAVLRPYGEEDEC
jgi:hypothetical protein